ncbi:uncharacterized protein C8Q71DRAFT_754069 [Rhodofomes roseus]|uniref:CRIB domain-containing protein n=1 Tax=Rhodofomes roseus TaxID=34475 RepID=A0ABQ8KIQ1_9APHY|nr:uncharacterized protein C8Q71DRAFT_754069 [Rhodofomes roseus]KAH9837715.1 hypothetical protein C8Q71DRAFT_754069 [Rhodofomes roseus]
MASKMKSIARRRCSSMLCLRGSSRTTMSTGATTAISTKRRSLGDLMKRPVGAAVVESQEQGDPSISYPWNFQHQVHVDESLNGLPPSWAAQLGVNEKGDLGRRSPATPSQPSPIHEKKPSLSVATKAPPLQDVDPNADARTGIFCFGPRKAAHNKALVVDVPPTGEGDSGISAPWGFKHNVHVDENFSGLPSGWTRPGESQRINKLLDMSPDADEAISVPWNFKHCFHVSVGTDGIPMGLPSTFLNRLGELGFSEGEIAAIRAAS